MRFLIFGDIVGKPGRRAIDAALPELIAEHQPDSVIMNIENIAHGAGISPSIVPELTRWQADIYTTGDHAWDNQAGTPLLSDRHLPIIRPANYPVAAPGRGYLTFTKGAYTVAVLNLQGQVFFKNHPASPFTTLDELLKVPAIAQAHIILLDIHAEATSEKRAMGWYADGRLSAMWGTHTHVPTADAQILPQGTGYITDVGFNGSHHSIIGVSRESSLQGFLTQTSRRLTIDESGPLELGALLLDINPTTKCTERIAHIRKIVNDKR